MNQIFAIANYGPHDHPKLALVEILRQGDTPGFFLCLDHGETVLVEQQRLKLTWLPTPKKEQNEREQEQPPLQVS